MNCFEDLIPTMDMQNWDKFQSAPIIDQEVVQHNPLSPQDVEQVKKTLAQLQQVAQKQVFDKQLTVDVSFLLITGFILPTYLPIYLPTILH